MRSFKYIYLLFLFYGGSLISFRNAAFTVNIHIRHISISLAPIKIAMYRKEDKFPDEKGYYKAFICNPDKTGESSFAISNIEAGEYAFALYQDENRNGKLDTNIFGYPKEPFCFSNNIKPLFSAPAFLNCKILVNEPNQDINVSLIK
jgi:uncharacterized protein (DUF2141 family)